jgi:competence CoiA-like predicted nuclease
MFVAKLNGERIEAFIAKKSTDFFCPHCGEKVVLKKGRIVTAHFAHSAASKCTVSQGETKEHLTAKMVLAESFRSRNLKAEYEFYIASLNGDRIADVAAWSPSGKLLCFELQHSNLEIKEIEKRSFSYANSKIHQMWIPLIPSRIWKKAEKTSNNKYLISKYTPRPFEKWVQGLYGGKGMWMFDYTKKAFYFGKLLAHELWVSESQWYSEGEEKSAGGYSRNSIRYRDLILEGPYLANELKIELKYRGEFSTPNYKWPKAPIINLVKP